MKEISICRRFKFDAAHKLPKYKGKCNNLHGHSFHIDVSISGLIQDKGESENGMIMDFGRLKEIVNKNILNLTDHKYLNESLPLEDPTAENMAELFFDDLTSTLKSEEPTIKLKFIRVWETEDAYAECREAK